VIISLGRCQYRFACTAGKAHSQAAQGSRRAICAVLACAKGAGQRETRRSLAYGFGGLARGHRALSTVMATRARWTMRYLYRRAGQVTSRRADRPRQRGPPCARYAVSRSAHFTMPIPPARGVT
jgi:hypothetical protein